MGEVVQGVRKRSRKGIEEVDRAESHGHISFVTVHRLMNQRTRPCNRTAISAPYFGDKNSRMLIADHHEIGIILFTCLSDLRVK